MKAIVLAFFVATFAFSVDSAIKGLGTRIECMNKDKYESRIYESKIKDAIMKLAQKLATEGLPEQGIPPLDPFVLDNFHLGINQSSIQLNLDLPHVDEVGITNIEIPILKFSLAGFKFNYGFNWPSIHAKGSYALTDALLGGKYTVYGKGDFDFEAINLRLEGSGKLGSDENKFLFLEQFNISASLEQFNAKITGLYDDEKLSEMAGQALTATVPSLFNEFHTEISDFLSNQITVAADKFLENKTISDIINGLGREDIDCFNQLILEL